MSPFLRVMHAKAHTAKCEVHVVHECYTGSSTVLFVKLCLTLFFKAVDVNLSTKNVFTYISNTCIYLYTAYSMYYVCYAFVMKRFFFLFTRHPWLCTKMMLLYYVTGEVGWQKPRGGRKHCRRRSWAGMYYHWFFNIHRYHCVAIEVFMYTNILHTLHIYSTVTQWCKIKNK